MPLNPNDPKVQKAGIEHLEAARLDDRRHRLHAEPATSAGKASAYWETLKKDTIEPSIGSAAREQLLRQIVWPLCSVEVVDDISDACSVVHHAQDRNISVELKDEKLQRDMETYLEQINLDGFVSNDCHNAHFETPNALVVVDLPILQSTPFPEPYLYIQPLEGVISARPRKLHSQPGWLDFAYFNLPKDVDNTLRRGLYDSEAYSVYVKSVKGDDWTLESPPAFHPLGHAPVFKLWSDVSSTNPLLSNTVLRPLLGKLDSLVIEDGSFRALRLTSSNPPFWHLETDDCDYQSDGMKCDGGLLFHMLEGRKEYTKRKCPRCAEKRKFGPGTTIPIPAQQKKEDPDWRVPAAFINVDVDALSFHRDWLMSCRADIVKVATGYEGSPMKKAAINEDQVMAILQRAQHVCQYLATHFENLHRNLINAIGKLRYGDQYIGCNVDYGRRFSVLTSESLMVLYQSAKEAGLSDWVLEEIDGMLQDYYARSDASRKMRYKMINALNRYPFRSEDELVAAQINTLDPYGFLISAGLSGLIGRFERENGVPIERFGTETDYNKRVQTISDTLYEYVKEQHDNRPVPDGQIDPTTGKPIQSSGQQRPAKPKPAKRAAAAA